MAPRATAGESAEGSGEAPRRSSRIAKIPVAEAPAAKPAVKKAASSKKRAAPEPSADEPQEEAAVTKKTKADSPTEGAEPAPAPKGVEPIDVGGNLPTLTVKNEKGEDVQVAELAAEKGVVLFLVPKADTPGCTQQACGFRDIYPDFSAHNFTVYCLSADTPAAQTKWQTKKELPYPLLSDPKRELIASLGALNDKGKTTRSHFVFAKGGMLVDKKIPVKPADSPRLALESVKALEVSG